MTVSRGLKRLLRIRELEEEQSLKMLESALAELRRRESALAASGERARLGRGLVEASARSGDLTDRLAGVEESRGAERLAAALGPRIAESQIAVAQSREDFLSKRVGRRQAETLIEEAEAKAAIEAARRSQQAGDDWYRNRKHQQEAREGRERRSADQAGESAGLDGAGLGGADQYGEVSAKATKP